MCPEYYFYLVARDGGIVNTPSADCTIPAGDEGLDNRVPQSTEDTKANKCPDSRTAASNVWSYLVLTAIRAGNQAGLDGILINVVPGNNHAHFIKSTFTSQPVRPPHTRSPWNDNPL